MKSFFDPCVDQIVELIKGQILQVEMNGSRVKVIAPCHCKVRKTNHAEYFLDWGLRRVPVLTRGT
jgi:hypothetical protein